MKADYKYDVFLSYSPKDKKKIDPIANHLAKEGIKVWFDAWEIRTGDNAEFKIEKGLEHSRTLLFCISRNTFGNDWPYLERRIYRFKDPLNRDRRFIPLRLDNSKLDSSLSQFICIDWRGKVNDFSRLSEACRPIEVFEDSKPQILSKQIAVSKFDLKGKTHLLECQLSPDWKYLLAGYTDNSIVIWDIEKRTISKTFKGHKASVNSVVWSNDMKLILSSSDDTTIKIWDVDSEKCLDTLKGHRDEVNSASWSPDQRYILSSSSDNTIRLWDYTNKTCISTFEGHKDAVNNAIWHSNQKQFISCSQDNTIGLWDVTTGRCTRFFEGHTDAVICAIWTSDEKRIITGSSDRSLKIWDIKTGHCLATLKGHDAPVISLSLSKNCSLVLSCSNDTTARLWNIENGNCLCILPDFRSPVEKAEWHRNNSYAMTINWEGSVITWNLSEYVDSSRQQQSKQTDFDLIDSEQSVQYTNAKVLLVGESSSGKTGLSKRLALNRWETSDSTVGAWATQWKLPITKKDNIEREIWLWDFGGQADQRLIHQLYMNETALAVLVFDGQKEDIYETIGQWDRDLSRASIKKFNKLLVAGRIDAGGLRFSRLQIEKFGYERQFIQLLETSAKTGEGCEELKTAIIEGIDWENIPWRSSPRLFQQLKEQIVKLKDEGQIIIQFKELRETLLLRMLEVHQNDNVRFTDEELKAVINLLSGPGILWELEFGSLILLQPERINAYAQAVIQTIREDIHELGCVKETSVLEGELTYSSSMNRLDKNEERFVLLAMHQMLVERGICLREHTENGTLLIFPSYYRRERPAITGHPAVLVSYLFNGFLDDIYSSLVVRLHHTKQFEQDQLWKYAADFKTLTKKQLGIKMTRRSEGAGEIEVFFEPSIAIEEKIIFSKYIHEHLMRHANEVVRLRHYVCSRCNTPVANREVAMRKLDEGKKDIVCVDCENRIPLWDELEQYFASEEVHEKVRELELQSQIVLDNESKERILVGEVISTTANAGQLYREFTVSDHGIDMEIEFKSDDGRATGKKIYLQLKSGDSYLKIRKSDGAEVFQVSKRHTDYWMSQAFPVFLVIRNSKGDIKWMEVRDWLRKHTNQGKSPIKQIVFEGERFDVMNIRKWREKILTNKSKQ